MFLGRARDESSTNFPRVRPIEPPVAPEIRPVITALQTAPMGEPIGPRIRPAWDPIRAPFVMSKTPLVAPATVAIVPPVRRAMFLSLMWGELHLGHEIVMVISPSIELRTRAWHDGDICLKLDGLLRDRVSWA